MFEIFRGKLSKLQKKKEFPWGQLFMNDGHHRSGAFLRGLPWFNRGGLGTQPDVGLNHRNSSLTTQKMNGSRFNMV